MTSLLDAMIIGVEKAGTTSLLRYLAEHEQVISHESLEMAYFVDEPMFRQGWDSAYRRFFAADADGKFVLAKNVGCIFWDHAPQRLCEHNPGMKIIAVLRNPVTRAYSAYRYARQVGREDMQTFEEAIKVEPDRLKRGDDFDIRYRAYLRRGHYAEQLRRVLRVFPEKQIKIVIYEEFEADPQAVVDDLFEFLGLPNAEVDISRRHNEPTGLQTKMPFWLKIGNSGVLKSVGHIIPTSVRKKMKHFLAARNARKLEVDPMKTNTRAVLERYYAADIGDLEEMLGRDLTLWTQETRPN